MFTIVAVSFVVLVLVVVSVSAPCGISVGFSKVDPIKSEGWY